MPELGGVDLVVPHERAGVATASYDRRRVEVVGARR